MGHKKEKGKPRVKCPLCDATEDLKIYWETVVWCPSCQTSSIAGDERYTLNCPDCNSSLVPRIKSPTPLTFCMECKKEFIPPRIGVEELVAATLD